MNRGEATGFSGIQGCLEFGGVTYLLVIFHDILKEAAETHGVNKSVKAIISALYLVLNVVVWGTVGADNNPAAGVASNSGCIYWDIYNCGDNKRNSV